MIRLTHLSGSLEGSSFTSEQDVIRIGRSAGCDLRYDADQEPKVAYHHGELVRDNGAYLVVDTDSESGILVNGRKVTRQKLESGDRIAFGVNGPEVRFEVISAAQAREAREEASHGANIAQISSLREQTYRTVAEVSKLSKTLDATEGVHRDESTARAVAVAARKVAEERARAGGQSSGHTMLIMADALEQVKERAQQTSRKKWVRIVAMVAAGAFLIVGVMSGVIYRQRKQLEELVQEKHRIDGEILAIHKQMQQETDPEKLDALDAKLELLTGSARKKLDELGKSDKARAAQAAEPLDDLDLEIRKILKKFNAETYSVPPLFKERLQFYVEEMVTSPYLKSRYAKKSRYWPVIQKAFAEAQLPEELGYVAWTESGFNPEALNPSGARGMWQLMEAASRDAGLRVDKKVDERTDVEKSTRAATRYLSKLLIEFGEQSFMLVLASYNKGENGVRRVLHKVAQEPGGFRKRDFWHLYRLKLLPEETREYVPRVLAAAIVLGNPGKYGLE